MLNKIVSLTANQKAFLALVLILPAPLLGVSCSFYFPPIRMIGSDEIEIGKVIWAIAKIWLLLLPVVWLIFIDKGKISWSPTNIKGVLAGFLWSIPFVIIIFGTFWFTKSDLDLKEVKRTINELGLSSPSKFIIFASVMSLGNSLMEEYVWRWFVFSKFKLLVGVLPAILLSAFFFTAHHVVILWNFGSLWLVILSSIGLFSAGIIWAWLYNKYNSIWPGWICHVAADAVILWISWWIVIS